MYDVYTRINNTHIRSWHGLRLVTVSDSELLLRSSLRLCRTELAWPVIDLTF